MGLLIILSIKMCLCTRSKDLKHYCHPFRREQKDLDKCSICFHRFPEEVSHFVFGRVIVEEEFQDSRFIRHIHNYTEYNQQ